jgi:hypothetical protein
MTGVAATLVAHYYICVFRQKVGDLGFSLVPELGPDNNYIGQCFRLSNHDNMVRRGMKHDASLGAHRGNKKELERRAPSDPEIV